MEGGLIWWWCVAESLGFVDHRHSAEVSHGDTIVRGRKEQVGPLDKILYPALQYAQLLGLRRSAAVLVAPIVAVPVDELHID